MKVLVTGGAGFIGSHIVERLLREKCEIVVVDDLSTGSRDNLPEEVKLVEMDIRDAALRGVVANGKFDALIHLAAQTKVPLSLQYPDEDCSVNVMGLVNVLEACRLGGVRRVLFPSTAAVYGDVGELPVLETARTEPASFYGLSKLVGERYLALYHQCYGMETIIFRYANVYGERQGDSGEGGVVSIFSRKLAENEALKIFGDGSQTRDFIYVGDVAEANWLGLNTAVGHGIYNISTQSEVSVNELLAQMESVSGVAATREYCAIREGDIYRSCLSHAAAKDALSWQPKTTLAEGLAKTYAALAGKG
ncbi:NAD-dependent epimerase/dehydratase family protein [Azotosporobacter soli]|uniref:NAD-dependent epimerase/dehydratase family protein n=1 Tax=Azotosporobacter soli TaxID=3055040 RepID=UPI0031FF0E91